MHEIEENIVSLLASKKMSIKEIAEELGISRQTASKYIYALKVKGLIDYRELGRAKVCFLSRKTPLLRAGGGDG